MLKHWRHFRIECGHDRHILPPYFKTYGVRHVARNHWRFSHSWSRQFSVWWHAALHLLPPRRGRWWRSNFAPPLATELRRLFKGIVFGQDIEFGNRSVGTVTLSLRWHQVIDFWLYDQCYPHGACHDCGRNLTLEEREHPFNDVGIEAEWSCFDCYDPTPYED